jgi:hypothetical protein
MLFILLSYFFFFAKCVYEIRKKESSSCWRPSNHALLTSNVGEEVKVAKSNHNRCKKCLPIKSLFCGERRVANREGISEPHKSLSREQKCCLINREEAIAEEAK